MSGLLVSLLVRIYALPAAVEFNKARRARLSVTLRSLDNESDFDVDDIGRGVCRYRNSINRNIANGALAQDDGWRRCGIRAIVLENGLRIASREHVRVAGLVCGNLRWRRVVHHVGDIRDHLSGKRIPRTISVSLCDHASI